MLIYSLASHSKTVLKFSKANNLHYHKIRLRAHTRNETMMNKRRNKLNTNRCSKQKCEKCSCQTDAHTSHARYQRKISINTKTKIPNNEILLRNAMDATSWRKNCSPRRVENGNWENSFRYLKLSHLDAINDTLRLFISVLRVKHACAREKRKFRKRTNFRNYLINLVLESFVAAFFMGCVTLPEIM